MQTNPTVTKPMNGDHRAGSLPAFERLSYFHGQLLGARDFRAEQAYFREKIKLLTRCLHGYGVVCGLMVEIEPEPVDCTPAEVANGRHGDVAIRISDGLGIDCDGNTVVLAYPLEHVRLRRLLSSADLRRLDAGDATTVYVSICYCEHGIELTRPVATHSCAVAEECTHARVREAVDIRVSLDRPDTSGCCDTCCCSCDAGCGGGCLLLAEITLAAEDPTTPASVHNHVRRMLSRHPRTTIVGLNWWHGATYSVDQASDLTEELVVEFSGAVRTDTLRRGVTDVVVHQGGRGNVGGIYYVPGDLDVPDADLTTRLVWRSNSDETFQNGDRILFTLRGDFVLDECCYPLDAEHVGGRVPPTSEAIEPLSYEPFNECRSPFSGGEPWTSGNGTAGGTFESWFYVQRDAGEAT